MQTLKALKVVRNARDIGESCSNIRQGVSTLLLTGSVCLAGLLLTKWCAATGILYRSACPVPADDHDVQLLCKELRIQHFVSMPPLYSPQHLAHTLVKLFLPTGIQQHCFEAFTPSAAGAGAARQAPFTAL